jgi:8-oxo-dGTP pyrophosphatase MutT (NUDIX family)
MEKVISSKIVFECPIFKVEEAGVELKDGSTAKRWYVVKNDAVAVVCLKDDKIVLTKEYRSASGNIQWRLPAGGVHEGEDPKKAAIRETREEIGLEPLDIKLLKTFPSTSSTIKQSIHCFLATRFKVNPLATGEKEEQDIEVKELTTEETEDLLNNGEIPDGISRCLRVALDELE